MKEMSFKSGVTDFTDLLTCTELNGQCSVLVSGYVLD